MDGSENLGAYTNTSTWRFHTFQAQALLNGKGIDETKEEGGKRYEIPGLHFTGKKLNQIWGCAKDDDPYAEMALIEIERLMSRANGVLEKHQIKVKKAFKNLVMPDGLDIVINSSTNTLSISLDDIAFRTTHAKQLLIIVARYDELVREIATYKEFGLIPAKQAKSYVYYITKAIRAVFMEALRFKKTGVTRNDIQQETPLGKVVVDNMGTLPLGIITGETVSEWGPKSSDSGVRH